jgi:hypothetical protein
MKTIRITWAVSVALILTGALRLTAQSVKDVTLNSYPPFQANGVNFPLQTNQIISIVGYDWTSNPLISGNLPDGTGINIYQSTNHSTPQAIQNPPLPQVITGLTNINLINSSYPYFPSWVTIEIKTPACENVVSNYIPADAIVIPSSATGNVQIILESSPDLVNWTAANPGTYGASSATNRFFRVRAVHN